MFDCCICNGSFADKPSFVMDAGNVCEGCNINIDRGRSQTPGYNHKGQDIRDLLISTFIVLESQQDKSNMPKLPTEVTQELNTLKNELCNCWQARSRK